MSLKITKKSKTIIDDKKPNHTFTKEIKSNEKTQINYGQFMKNHISIDENYTHTSIVGGKWIIEDDIETFYNLYSDEIKKGKELYITEKHQKEYGPIIIDFDFKYIEKIKSPITTKIIDNIIANLTSIIKNTFINEDLTCIVSKRPEIYQDKKSGKYKDGIHIIFPCIITSYEYQFALRKKYIEIMQNDIKDIPFYVEESKKDKYLYDIYDKSVIKDNNWFIYMSTKPNTKPYIIFKIYNNQKFTLSHIHKMQLVEIIKLMSIRNKTKLSNKCEKYDEFMLDYYANNIELNDIIKKKKVKLNLEIINNENYKNDEKVLWNLLNCLSIERNNTFRKWIRIGFILFNESINDKSIDYFTLWKKWSQLSSYYTIDCCEKFWNFMKYHKSGLTIGSLHYYSKKDNYDEYKKIMTSQKINIKILTNKLNNDDFIYNKLMRGEIGHSELFYDKYKENIFVTKEKGDAYVYDPDTTLWVIQISSSFYYKISLFLRNIVLEQIELISKKGKQTLNDEDYNITSLKTNNLSRLLKQINKKQHLKSVWEIVLSKFYKPEFLKKINNIAHLLPIKNNKVINLKTGMTENRISEHYFTFECPVNYIEGEIPNADKFFLEIMNNNKESAKYLQKCLGYCITGEVKSRCMFICWGEGSNGKSSVNDLLNLILGPLHVAGSKNVFVKNENDSSSASPHLIPLIGARICTFCESDKQDKLNESLIKSLTGYDIISARPLYGSTIQFKPICKPIMMTNHKPIFNVDDQAILDRLKYIPFNARFVDNPKKGQYKKDSEFIEKLGNEFLSEVFTWLVKGSIEWYKDNKIIPPECILEETNNYINELDHIGQFIIDKCLIEDNCKIERSRLYEIYMNWCKDN